VRRHGDPRGNWFLRVAGADESGEVRTPKALAAGAATCRCPGVMYKHKKTNETPV
jgi:hypothetical protein